MRQLYLHIGYPKTGTTAIQEFMRLNREILLKQKILYPETGIKKNSHHQIPWVFTDDCRANVNLSRSEITSGLKKEYHDNPSVEKVVISSEGFIFAVKPEDALEMFRDDFDDIKLIIYMRQPFRWIQSDYNQGVKGWRQLTCSFDEHLNSILSSKDSPMNFYNMLSKWASVFGWGNLIVRSYDVERLDLTSSFLKILGVKEPSEFIIPECEDSNPRLSVSQLERLRAINALELSDDERKWLLGQISDVETAGVKGVVSVKENFFYHLDKSMLKRINKNNKKLLKYFDKNIFEKDFFTLINPDKDKVLMNQIDINRLTEMVQPLAAKLLDSRR